MMLAVEEIRAARERIRPHIVETPFLESRTLGRITGRRVYCKFENLQMTGSFKERGALNKLLQLGDAARKKGVAAASAGNHAQGLAYHAARLGIPVTVVMPKGTPLVKVTHTEEMGARVILQDGFFDEAHALAVEIARREGLTLVHPFDDPEVIAGQGTIGLELAESRAEFDTLLVPVGGGGLIAGVSAALKALRPSTRVIGVEAEAAPSMAAALQGRAGAPARRTIADGIAVKEPGRIARQIVERFVDEMISVSEDMIAHAVQLLLEVEKSLVEGAGAVGLAALLQHGSAIPGSRCALILSGGNMDITMLSRIIERGLAMSGRLARLAVCVPDSPGSLAAVAACISEAGGNIREVSHQRAFTPSPVGEAMVELTVETRSAQHVDEIVEALGRIGAARVAPIPEALKERGAADSTIRA